MRRAWVVGLLAAAVAVGMVTPAHAAIVTPPPKVVLVYGDSLMWESSHHLAAQFTKAKWTVPIVGVGGSAPCDMLPMLQADLAATPTVDTVVIEETGNSWTPCMHGAVIGDDTFYAEYAVDLAALVATIRGAGARPLFVPGPSASSAWFADVEGRVAAIAASAGFTVVNAATTAVTNAGTYASTLPCLKSELLNKWCVGGQIPVRSPDGLHFCPAAFVARPTPCPTYSSGELRWSKAIAAAVKLRT